MFLIRACCPLGLDLQVLGPQYLFFWFCTRRCSGVTLALHSVITPGRVRDSVGGQESIPGQPQYKANTLRLCYRRAPMLSAFPGLQGRCRMTRPCTAGAGPPGTTKTRKRRGPRIGPAEQPTAWPACSPARPAGSTLPAAVHHGTCSRAATRGIMTGACMPGVVGAAGTRREPEAGIPEYEARPSLLPVVAGSWPT